MEMASKLASTAEQSLDVIQFENIGPDGFDRMLQGAGTLANKAENASPSSTSGEDPKRHRRKKNRPVQYRPVDKLGVATRSAETVHVDTNHGYLEEKTTSDDHIESLPVNSIGIADIHKTIARQLEQASAATDSEHQPCPFCSYIFSSVVFLVGHLKYRHGINLEMEIGMPTDFKESHHKTNQQSSGSSQQDPSPHESNCLDKVTENGAKQIRSFKEDCGSSATQIKQSNEMGVDWTRVEGEMTESSKELMLQRMSQLIGPKLNRVTADHPPSQSIIICDMCTRAFTSLDDLEQHRRIHNVAKAYECQHCHKLFQNPSSLKKHTKLHTDGKIYPCNYCDKSFAAAAYLKTHLRLHTKQKPFACKHCGKAFAASGTLISHERIHINDKPYGCEVCGKRFRQGNHLNRHKVIHTNIKPHACGKCNRAFADVANLRRHERIHKQDNPNVCGECGKSFINLSSLKKHERIHTNEKPYICRHCSKPFSSSGNLISHERTHTNERPYICKECGKAFTQSSHLKAHMGTHSTDFLYVCKHCGRGFTQRSTLCVHERIHLNKKPYICTICNRAFTQSGTLKAHIRTHTKERAHVCKVCGKAFSARGNLRSHELIHTNEKPFKCGACPKTFKQGSTLRTHERTHTNEKPYVCHACGKTFADRGYLRAHSLRVHSKSTNLGVSRSDDHLTDAVLAQTDDESSRTEELCPVNQLIDIRTDPGDSCQSPPGIKIKKTVYGLTSMLRSNKEGTMAVEDSVHHKPQVKSITIDDSMQGTHTCVQEEAPSVKEQIADTLHDHDEVSKPASIKSEGSTNSMMFNSKGAAYSHLSEDQPHLSLGSSELDLTRGHEILRKARKAIPCGFNVNKVNIQSFEERTPSQNTDVVSLLKSYHHTDDEAVGGTNQAPRLNVELTFDEDDEFGSLPIADNRNNSDSELFPSEDEHTTCTDFQSFAKHNPDLPDSCTVEFSVDNHFEGSTSLANELVRKQNLVEDLEPSQIILLNS